MSSAQAQQLQSVVEGNILGMLQETSTILQQQHTSSATAAAPVEQQQLQLEPAPTAAVDVSPSTNSNSDAPAAIHYTSAVPPMLLLLQQQCGTVEAAQHTAPAPSSCVQPTAAASQITSQPHRNGFGT